MTKTIILAVLIGTLIGLALLATGASADGTEELGVPSVPLASGSGIAVGGTGMMTGMGTINIEVPDGATVHQVLLYWAGEFVTADDDSMWIDGNNVTGSLIGGPKMFYEFNGDVKISVYRADVTALGIVSAGANTVPVAALDYDRDNGGAGLLVIYQLANEGAVIDIRDGSDLAYFDFAPSLDTTVPQSFTFSADDEERTGELSMFVSSVGGDNRPNKIVIDVGGVQTIMINPLSSVNGSYWDTIMVPVTIPADVTSITVQVLSEGDGTGRQPASLNWIVAGITVPTEPTSLALLAFLARPAPVTSIIGLFCTSLFILVLLTAWGVCAAGANADDKMEELARKAEAGES